MLRLFHDLPLIPSLAGCAVLLAAAYLIGLAIGAFVAKDLIVRFLGSFASSLRAHLVEQCLRLLMGTGLVLFAPSMRFTVVFQILGWMILVTSIGLLVPPWRWHQRFAQRAVPPVLRHVRLFGIAAGLLGVFVLYSMS